MAVKFSVFNREADYQRLRPVEAERGYAQDAAAGKCPQRRT